MEAQLQRCGRLVGALAALGIVAGSVASFAGQDAAAADAAPRGVRAAAPVAVLAPDDARATVALRECLPRKRAATFEVRAQRLAGSVRVGVRVALLERRDGTPWRTLGPRPARWLWSTPGASALVVDRKYRRLRPGRKYRVRVDVVWRDRRGAALARAKRLSPVCRVPPALPNLRPVSLAIRRGGLYKVVVRNAGSAPSAPTTATIVAGPWQGTVAVPALRPGSVHELATFGPPCPAGSVVTATVDPGRVVRELNEGDNTLAKVCPPPVSR